MRRPFGGSAATVLVNQSGAAAGGLVTAYETEAGGPPADLVTADTQAPIQGAVLTADNYGRLPDFLGPDNGAGALWIDGGIGSRLLILSNDLHDRIGALEQATADLQTAVQNGGGGGGTASGIDGGSP